MRQLVHLLPVLVAGACSSPEPRVDYSPYTGDPAFPSSRAKMPKPDGYLGFVSDNGSDTISVLDLPSGKLLLSATVGRDPVDIDGPHHLAVASDGYVYVALSYPAPAVLPGPHAAHASSTRSGYVLKLAPDDLRPVGEVRVDPNPGEIVLSADGSKLVVTHFDLKRATNSSLSPDDRRSTLVVIDPKQILTTGTPEPRRIPVCLAGHGASLSRPDGALAYVACYGEDAIAVVDLKDPAAPVQRIGLPGAGAPGAPVRGPYSAVMSPAGDTLAVGLTEGKAVLLFDTATRAITPISIQARGAAYFSGWSPDGATLYVPTQAPDALLVADVKTGTVVNQRVFDRTTCQRPHEVTLGREADRIYLVCEGDQRTPSVVLALDAATLETRATSQVGVYPDRLFIPAPR